MPYQVVWNALNAYVDDERQTLTRGDFLPEELDEVQVSQLATIGAVQFVDTSLAPATTLLASVANAPIAPVSTPESPFPETPPQEKQEEVVDVVVVQPDGSAAFNLEGDPAPGQYTPQEANESDPAAPPKSAPKAEWVDYATKQGLSKDEAESMSKADLVDKYGTEG
jgi:hypothetical protein